MSIISLRRYMNESQEDLVFRRTISTLMQGMVLHAVQGDPSAHEKLQAAIDEIDAGLPDSAYAEEVLNAAGIAIQRLAEYNDRTSRFIGLQSAELHHMIAMLTDTVISVGSCTEYSTERLKEIEQQLEQAVALDEVQQLKRRLGECLASLREESARQKAEAAAASSWMREQLASARYRVEHLAQGCGEIDQLTGLPAQVDAEIAIADALEHPNRRTYLAAFLADRIQAVNLRFGYAVGDRLLAAVAQMVRSQLSGQDRLFRWRGPGVVALIDRYESLELIRAQMARASVSPTQQMFEIEGRQVMIPVSAAWCLFPLNSPLDVIIQRVHSFIAGTPAEAV
ncbi:MAG TPA: diguanylate cyclase [Bryobacteraceae bacterium]|nr:diguanylate cyclase [Bryobacteraceae bacterium]